MYLVSRHYTVMLGGDSQYCARGSLPAVLRVSAMLGSSLNLGLLTEKQEFSFLGLWPTVKTSLRAGTT